MTKRDRPDKPFIDGKLTEQVEKWKKGEFGRY